MDTLSAISTRLTPQSRRAAADQSPNSAGGYTFTLDDAARLRRFLILGVDGGTYYTSAQDLAIDNLEVLERMAAEAPRTLVDTIVEVSTSGAAPRQNPALFALAYATSVPQAREDALAALPRVVRTGSHLFTFAGYVEQFRGWGRGLRRAVGSWYTGGTADRLAYQAVKYRQREGWTHRDLLRLAHPRTDDAGLRAAFDWIAHGAVGEATPSLIEGFIKAQEATAARSWAQIVRDYRLTWEMLPDAALARPEVWDALLDVGVPMTALMRQLPRLTRLGMLPAIGGRTKEVCAQLTDADRLRKARVHPVSVLVAQRTYAGGASHRGADGEGRRRAGRGLLRGLRCGRALREAHHAGRGRLRIHDHADLGHGDHRPRGVGRAGPGAAGDRAGRDGLRILLGRRLVQARPDPIGHLAAAPPRRCPGRGELNTHGRHRLRTADAARDRAGARGGHVRHLHRQRDLVRQSAPASGAAALPGVQRHRCAAHRGRHDIDGLLHRRSG